MSVIGLPIQTRMGTTSKYWRLVKLDSSGKRQISEIPSARAFFTVVFPEWVDQAEVPDPLIQQQLIQWVRSPETLNHPELNAADAELNLLCFISWEIEQVCYNLATKFGANHGFSGQDLLPFVLDEEGRRFTRSAPKQTGSYQSLVRKILQTFDPQQSSLSTWTNRCVKCHPELNQFLLDCGVYLVSDWAILNDTRPQQLERIFTEFYQLSSHEIRQSCEILTSYHAIYRTQRLQNRQSGGKRPCLAPTDEQYQKIAQLLQAKSSLQFPAKAVEVKLQKIASLLREYRIYIRSGKLSTTSLDRPETRDRIESIPASHDSEDASTSAEQEEFLTLYRQQFLFCLDGCIEKVIGLWLQPLKKKDLKKSEQFLLALHLFHCQGQSMGEIAKKIDLKAQYQVTRLLKLKSFRADITQHLLIQLRDRILESAKNYTDLKRLDTLNQQIEDALMEQINKVMEEAESEAHIAQNRPTDSLFSKRVCQVLDHQILCKTS